MLHTESPVCTSLMGTGHVVPEARLGGPIALVQDGDKIIIDSASRTIDWDVSTEEIARRQAEWAASKKSELTIKRGVLMRYARDVAVRAAFWRRSLY